MSGDCYSEYVDDVWQMVTSPGHEKLSASELLITIIMFLHKNKLAHDVVGIFGELEVRDFNSLLDRGEFIGRLARIINVGMAQGVETWVLHEMIWEELRKKKFSLSGDPLVLVAQIFAHLPTALVFESSQQEQAYHPMQYIERIIRKFLQMECYENREHVLSLFDTVATK